MTSDARLPPAADMILQMGNDPAAAQALGHACGISPQQADMAALAEALRQGQFCVVVWADPHEAVAQALRGHSPPSVAAAVWSDDCRNLLRLFTRNRRKLLMVSAALIALGDPADLDRLAARLALPHPLIPPQAPVEDLAAMLAQLTVAHLTDLRPVWEELQGSSLAPFEASHSSADLDRLAQLLADQHHHQTADGVRQRTTVQDLLRNLADASDTLAAAQASHAADAQRLTRLDEEARLLRDQLGTVSGAFAQAHHAALQQAEQDLLTEKKALLQEQVRTAAELELVRSQLVVMSRALGDAESASEVVLLREQLVAVTDLLQQGADSIGPAHVQIESAFATLLAALTTETDLRRKAQNDLITAKAPPRGKSSLRQPVPARPGI